MLGSDLTDISEHSEVSSIQETIPKPAGAAGRPESGGYNLAAAMHWSGDTFKRLQVGDQSKILHILRPNVSTFKARSWVLISKHLEVKKTYSHQKDCDKQIVREKVSNCIQFYVITLISF
jgi:hypothetical protein